MSEAELTSEELERTLRKLLSYCRANDWAGYDPYDALNSKMFEVVPLLNNKAVRLVLTQALKRSPFNCRSVLLVPKTRNPKAIGLFLSSLLKLASLAVPREECIRMIDVLIALRSRDTPYYCWGYSFPWQTRTQVVPSGAPNLVCTTFAANALLDAYQELGDTRLLEIAVSASEFFIERLFWTDATSVASFSYPLPFVRSRCHNANFLAAALLCRVYRYTGQRRFLEIALRVATYSASRQRADGSWLYGELPKQDWIDHFHTGYNLCALQCIARDASTSEFDRHMERGFSFYRDHFFREDGAPKYFHNWTYPIDIHCVAQAIITLMAYRNFDPRAGHLATRVFRWAINNLWDDRGFFYYRALRLCTIRTSYMRWSQAWMLFALANLYANSSVAARVGSIEAFA